MPFEDEEDEDEEDDDDDWKRRAVTHPAGQILEALVLVTATRREATCPAATRLTAESRDSISPDQLVPCAASDA